MWEVPRPVGLHRAGVKPPSPGNCLGNHRGGGLPLLPTSRAMAATVQPSESDPMLDMTGARSGVDARVIAWAMKREAAWLRGQPSRRASGTIGPSRATAARRPPWPLSPIAPIDSYRLTHDRQRGRAHL